MISSNFLAKDKVIFSIAKGFKHITKKGGKHTHTHTHSEPPPPTTANTTTLLLYFKADAIKVNQHVLWTGCFLKRKYRTVN